jgi:hypothetical protein
VNSLLLEAIQLDLFLYDASERRVLEPGADVLREGINHYLPVQYSRAG